MKNYSMVFTLIFLHSFFLSFTEEKIIIARNTCINSCLSCQNALYHLKFDENGQCQFNLCPETCIDITQKYNSNKYFNDFRSNRVNICEACFRESYCHIKDCLAEKAILNQAISEASKMVVFHTIDNNRMTFDKVFKNSEDFYTNMDFIVRNLSKMKKIIQRLVAMRKEFLDMKTAFKQLLRVKLPNDKIKALDYGAVLEEKEFLMYFEPMHNIDILNSYYKSLKSKQIHLSDKKALSKVNYL